MVVCVSHVLTKEFMTAARRSPKGTEEQHLLRLQCPVTAVGVTKVWRLHLPLVRRRPPRAGRAHFVCAQYLDGRIQGERD